MQKRGQLLKTIGFMLSFLLLLLFVGLLGRITNTLIAQAPEPAVDDLARYYAELSTLQPGESIPVATLHGNYTLAIYSPSAQKPLVCGQNACICVYASEEAADQFRSLKCEPVPNIDADCSTTHRCLAQPTMMITKSSTPPLQEIYFCQDFGGEITVALSRSECEGVVRV